jgi:hypothetical protein
VKSVRKTFWGSGGGGLVLVEEMREVADRHMMQGSDMVTLHLEHARRLNLARERVDAMCSQTRSPSIEVVKQMKSGIILIISSSHHHHTSSDRFITPEVL